MSIVYDWLNPNKDAITKIEIYRAAKRGGDKTLLATLPPTALAYEDTTAQINRVYYYSSLVYQDDLKTWSIEQPLASFESTGLGSDKLLRGNWEFGYFGSVDKTLMPTFTEVAAAAGITTDSAAISTLKVFHKWIVGGRILFIPDCAMMSVNTTASGYTLMQKKLMPALGQTDKDLFSFTKGSNKYIIRTPYLDNRESTAGDGSLFISNSGITSDNGSYLISEVMALLASFSGSDNTNVKRMRVNMWYADSPLLDTTTFGSYFWTGSFYLSSSTSDNGTSQRPMIYAGNLTQANWSDPAFGRLFWPVFVLDLTN